MGRHATDTIEMKRLVRVFTASVVAAALFVGGSFGVADAGQKNIPIPMCRAGHMQRTDGGCTVALRLRNRTSHSNHEKGVWSVAGVQVDRTHASAVVPPHDHVEVFRSLGSAHDKPR